MNIDKARLLERGDRVICPSDRGSVEIVGKVVGVNKTVHKTPSGVEYVWVEVRALHTSVWPSNRLVR